MKNICVRSEIKSVLKVYFFVHDIISFWVIIMDQRLYVHSVEMLTISSHDFLSKNFVKSYR